MQYEVWIGAVFRCIGTLARGFLKKSNKEKIEPTMALI